MKVRSTKLESASADLDIDKEDLIQQIGEYFTILINNLTVQRELESRISDLIDNQKSKIRITHLYLQQHNTQLQDIYSELIQGQKHYRCLQLSNYERKHEGPGRKI